MGGREGRDGGRKAEIHGDFGLSGRWREDIFMGSRWQSEAGWESGKK